MIPLPQTVTIVKASTLDEWGQPVVDYSDPYPCRIDQTSKSIINNDGKLVTTSAHVLIKGLVQVTYADKIQWTDLAGNDYEQVPLKIEVMVDLNGKPMFTKVVV